MRAAGHFALPEHRRCPWPATSVVATGFLPYDSPGTPPGRPYQTSLLIEERMQMKNRDKQIVLKMGEFVDQQVAAGFAAPDEITEWAVKCFSDDLPATSLRPIAEGLVTLAVEAHLEQQATWPAVTDCDRLDNAFAELEQNGIMRRQDYDIDLSGGNAALTEEMKIRVRGRPQHPRLHVLPWPRYGHGA